MSKSSFPKDKVPSGKHPSLVSRKAQVALRGALRRLAASASKNAGVAVAEIAACLALRSSDPVIAIGAGGGANLVRKSVTHVSGPIEALQNAVAGLAAQKDRVALVCCRKPTRERSLRDVLRFSGAHRLPILFLVAGRMVRRRPQHSLHSDAAKTGVPALVVDAHDAIAVFRVVTEAAHNARLGRGPSLLEMFHLPAGHASPSPEPLEALEAYMRRHGTLR